MAGETVHVYTDTAQTHTFGTAANWSTAEVPDTGDTLVFNDLSLGPLTIGIAAGDLAAQEYTIIVDRGFKYYVGTEAIPFEPALGMPAMIFRGVGTTSSYFRIPTGQDCDIAYIDSQSSKEDIVILDGAGTGEYDEITVRNGKVKMAASSILASGGFLHMLGGTGNASAEMNILTGSTMTGTYVDIGGGRLTTNVTLPSVDQHGGEFIIEDNADITDLDIFGGTTYWDGASSTITKAQVFAGMLMSRKNRLGRIMTNMDVFGSGQADFTVGGTDITFSNAPRQYGDNPIKMPVGTTVTFGF